MASAFSATGTPWPFKLIASGLPVAAVVAEVAALGGLRHPRAIDMLDNGWPVAEVDAREPGFEPEGCVALGGHVKRGVPIFPGHPKLQALLDALVRAIGHHPYWVMLRALQPGRLVKPHRDRLSSGVARYHLALRSEEGVTFEIEGCRQEIRTGELWLTDVGNRLHHLENHSGQERLALIIDVLEYDRIV